MKNESESGPTKTEILFSGVPVNVRLMSGDMVQLKVHILPNSQMEKMLDAQQNESKLAELFCQQASGWADTVHPASIEEIVIEGERLNADFFARWYQRHMARVDRIMPGMKDKLMLGLQSLLPTGLPNSPSSVDSPGTKP